MQRTRQILRQAQTDEISDETIFRTVCQDIAANIETDLVSIWYTVDQGSCIECLCKYDVPANTFSKGQKLYKESYPHYFESVFEQNFISAPHAQTHPDTKELAESYLIPNGIQSLLDFILHENYKANGVICCENRSQVRHWSDEDRSYLRSIAFLISSLFQLN